MKVAASICFATVASSTAGTNPIAKVVDLLQSLKGKVVAEGEQEQKTYEEYAKWCSDVSKEKTREVEDSQEAVQELTATIAKAAANIDGHTAAIGELSAKITSDEADLKQAAQIRAKEHADFSATDAELAEVVDSLERALDVLGRKLQGSLVQISKNQAVQDVLSGLSAVMSAASVQQSTKAQLASLLQSGDDGSEGGSQAILSTINDLLEKAQAQRSEAAKAELVAKHNFMLTKQALESSVATAKKELSQAKHGKAANQQVKATAEGDLAETQKELAEDTKTLNEAHDACEDKAHDWDVSMQERNHEIRSIEQAIKIISEKTGGATNQAYGLVQTKLQVGARKSSAVVETARALMSLGKSTHDRQIAMLAVRVRAAAASSDDPFSKVKDLINSMIERLEKDAASEADQKAFCDKEYAKSHAKKDDHESSISTLSARIDRAKARMAKLKREISTISTELSTIAEDQAEATTLRQEQHASFKQAEADYSAGVEGVEGALKILREYFSTQSFLQGQGSKSDGAASSIIGILEVAASDFGKLLAEAREVEQSAEEEYEQMSENNKVATATKKQDIKYKGEELAELKAATADNQNDRATEEEELDAVAAYISKLNDECVAKPEPYEERKRRRAEEIEGLKDALEILEGDAIPSFLAVSRHLRGH
mmetsp:Transcript_9131/g.22969  ORF Transcript_9131/g.22969 Transcript_9131/m.22969 type:complete len:660 (+) Transcript_9131:95-2074(+)